ncbi:FAD-dependent thymidylate synthase [Patescibacteria group bacterium]|nr:FAD-dependent thymidylate synthase [Patescibacteria group bacterium]
MVEILKNAGNYEILTPVDWLTTQLLLIEKAGRTCYQSEHGLITPKTADKFIRMLIKRGHYSQLEHSWLMVQFNDCSRGFTHELVRHRLAAFSQESTRYVDYTSSDKDEPDLAQFNIKFIVPPHRDENQVITLTDGRTMTLSEMAKETEEFYRGLRQSGWKPEDARQILPNGIKSQIVMSCNLREWRHVFFMRTAIYAHWEIRPVMCTLLRKLKEVIPVIFEDFVEKGIDDNGVPYFEQIKL